VAEAEAAEKATGRSMVAFNYRRVPHLALARQLIAAGPLGDVRHVRAQYLQDRLVDPDFPLVWRLREELRVPGRSAIWRAQLPISVDGMTAAASMSLLADSRRSRSKRAVAVDVAGAW
jgi:hypothetical protein